MCISQLLESKTSDKYKAAKIIGCPTNRKHLDPIGYAIVSDLFQINKVNFISISEF